MCSQREQQLEQYFVGIPALSIAGVTILTAHLAELAGPVGQHHRTALVGQIGKFRAVSIIVTSAKKPSAAKLIVSRSIEAE